MTARKRLGKLINRRHLLADEMHDDGAIVRRQAVFPQVKTLPGAQSQPASTKRDRHCDQRQGCSDVRRHVVLPFGGVQKQSVTVRDQAFEEGIQVASNIRVGILLHQKRSRSVNDLQSQQTRLKPILGNPSLDLVCKFIKTTPASLDSDFLQSLT